MVLYPKTIWIIGASSGIGAALARFYSEAGCRVIVSARRGESLDELASQYEQMIAMPADVEQPAQLRSVLEFLTEQNVVPDLVIYCAAVYEPGGLEVLCHDQASRHMRINYLGFLALLEVLLPVFHQRREGHLAVVASLSGYRGLPKAALYGPSKAALINLCETIQPEFEAQGLALSIINPGFVKTPMTDKNSFAMPFLLSSEQAAQIIAKRLLRAPFEIAFPWPMVLILKILRLMPYRLYFWLSKRLVS